MQFRRQHKRHTAAAVARNRRPRPVPRQFDLLRQLLQRSRPERKLPRDRAVRIPLVPQHRLLPQRVVGVLHRQRRKPHRKPTRGNTVRTGIAVLARLLIVPRASPLASLLASLLASPLAARPVEPRQVPRQWPQRPAVAGDVMQQHQQHMLVCGKLKQMRPQRQFARQIEPTPRRSRQRSRQIGFSKRRDRKRRPRSSRIQDRLPRHPKPLREYRAQALVPHNKIAQRTLQRRTVEPAHKPHRKRDHIRPAATRGAASRKPAIRMPAIRAAASGAIDNAVRGCLQPVQEPQPALRIRQRNLRRTQLRQKRRPQRTLRRREPARKLQHARRLEQAADRYLHRQRRTDPADQTRCQQRMPTELKEVVLDPDLPPPQHLRKQRTQDRLLRRPRRTVRRAQNLWRRQRTPVELAVRRQRQPVKRNDRRRHHVVRQVQAERRTQRGRIDDPTLGRDHIPHQTRAPGTARVRPRDHNRLRHPRLRNQQRLDLARLDPEPAQLHLRVRPPQELQHSVPAPSRQVPRPVHPRTRAAR